MDSETPKQKGNRTEKNIGIILASLRDEGLIRGYRKTRQYSADDRRGIDYWIFTEGPRVPLQVKSSHRARFVHESYSHKSWIPCVVWNNSVDYLKKLIMRMVQQYQKGRYGNTTR